jgi:fibronectin type 3 domain-containing protein
MMKKPITTQFAILFVLFIVTILYNNKLFSDFIIEEEEKEEKAEKSVPRILETVKELPDHIAKNIKAEPVLDIKGAIRISWDFQKESNDDYIVGRSMEVPDTMDKVLKAIPVKVVPAGAKPEVIDSNLKPGTYYYCIAAKSKIIDRDIALYANQNYTLSPVVLEADSTPVSKKILPQQISLIYARILNNARVRITWRGIEDRGIIYTIYRSTSILDSPEKFAQAEKVKEIIDGRESFVDSNIIKGGTYYYAVTTKDAAGKEDLNLQPEQSYTVSGIAITLEVPAPVSKISAVPVDYSVKISWNKTSPGVSEYLIYRYSNAISDSDRLGLSTFLGRSPEDTTVYYDKSPEAGHYYYAVLTKLQNGKVLNDLIKGENYTPEPVVLGRQILLQSFISQVYGRDIELTWIVVGNLGNKNYTILRKTGSIRNVSDLQGADLVAHISIFDNRYIDKNLTDGSYYYAIVPDPIDDKKKLSMEEGINVTGKTTVISKVIAETQIPVKKTREILPAKKPVLPLVEKSSPVIVEKKEVQKNVFSGVDAILQAHFFKGSYKNTVAELEYYIKNSANEFETAKAKLFIGRSYIELKMYEEAVSFLAQKDVNQKFPADTKFWMDFALIKIKNGENNITNDNF